jgi:hypothetical protein
MNEARWIEIFYALRNGTPESAQETRGSSGMFIVASGDRDKFFQGANVGQELSEMPGRQTLNLFIPGEKPVTLRQPKIIDTAQEMDQWADKVDEAVEQFRRKTMGDEAIVTRLPALNAERDLWEALMLATTEKQVRQIVSRSKRWLKSRYEFPSGGHVDFSFSPFPRALYIHAAQFCAAKLDTRYPADDTRPSGDYRRLEYLARVMAGLSLGKPKSPSYSIEVFRKMKHSDECCCWRCTVKVAPRYPCSLARYLSEL